MRVFSKKIYFPILLIVFTTNTNAQTNADAEYLQVVKERAYKITAPLQIKDSAKFYSVREKIAQEYVAIKKIDDKKATAISGVKAKGLEKAATDAKIEKINSTTEEERAALNKRFVKSLSKQLTANQIEQVKNGLTYNVLPITYKAHLDMIPSLKEEEKTYIHEALVEAREHAMVAGSSDAKHAWFGKYKGRINNYLAARGYDLKKEREGWKERQVAQKNNILTLLYFLTNKLSYEL
ncbi:DUF3826 domain-containing protein [Niabella ginsengisoli]|uniref:DUF3826 domain-containing protein n=1 Tax=Niabella ginsengisoli TaxID=522298 RepID=A0ABS9SHF0_9BACT|nr:DUF3826 domain-containing protein [Niabella ginsengisoli]MCH5597782.1 DUF3826 domain-containing protein [Niabella ginsengisoli]